jgi:hypothetical protein
VKDTQSPKWTLSETSSTLTLAKTRNLNLSKVNNLPKFIVPSQLLKNLSIGHEVPISHQDAPGKQHQMAGPDPVNDQLPTHDGGYQPYKAAGKLAGKKALITGGDSGIGRAVAILYAMEGADSTIVYTPEEEPDARKTQELVRAKGGQIHLLQADLRKQQECKSVVEKAVQAMGRINILVLNHGTQAMKESISELSE